jgi:hypothetical protein
MNKLEEIKQLYLRAAAQTIRQDMARAIEILKSMGSEEERERAAVYMDGLSQMLAEWGRRRPGAGPIRHKPKL